MFSLLNICDQAGSQEICVSLAGRGAVVEGWRWKAKVGQPMPFPLLLIPIINLLLPDEPIRYPRPATQGAIYLID